MYRLIAPTSGFPSFDLYRSPGESEVTVHLFADAEGMGGDTYLMNHEALALWLVKVGCKHAPKVVDLCWNFPHVHYDLGEQRFSCPDDDRIDPGQGSMDHLAQAAFGMTVPFDFKDYIGPFDGPQGGMSHGQ